MANLDALLTGEAPEEQKTGNSRFDELHISRYAYDKAFRYAMLIIKARRRSLEIGGFLTQPADSTDTVARDVFLARDQEVTAGNYRVGAEDVLKAKKELDEQGQKIIGWWHSHGRLDTFHSSTDDGNQMVLLNQIAPSNYVTVNGERAYNSLQSRVEGNRLVFWDPENPAVNFELELKGENPELAAQRLRILEDKKIGFAYSFVVNYSRWVSRRVPHCEIATRDLCNVCTNTRDVSNKVGYRLFDGGEYVLDDAQLMAEIEEKVHVAGESKKKGSYFLPSVFEQQRADGTLAAPDFAPGSWWGSLTGKSPKPYYPKGKGGKKR